MMRRTGGLVRSIGLSLSIATQGAGTSPVLSSSRVREIYCPVQACDTPGVKNNVTSSEMGTCGPFKVTSTLRCGVGTKQIKSEIAEFMEEIKKDDGSPALSPEQIRDTVEKLEKQEIMTVEQLKKLNEEQIRACTIPVGRAAIIYAELQKRAPQAIVAAVRALENDGIISPVTKQPKHHLYLDSNNKFEFKSGAILDQVPYEPREKAIEVLSDQYLAARNTLRQKDYNYNSRRLPLVANAGFAGTGKTTLLEACCYSFVHTLGASGGRQNCAIFITMNSDQTLAAAEKKKNTQEDGHTISLENADAQLAIRIVHRVLKSRFSGGRSKLDLGFFKQLTAPLVDWSSLGLIDALEAVRELLRLPQASDILLACDELVKVPEEFRYTYLSSLVQTMSTSFEHTEPSPKQNIIYVIASAYRIFDVVRLVTESGRPVMLQPLPFLDFTTSFVQNLEHSVEKLKIPPLIPGASKECHWDKSPLIKHLKRQERHQIKAIILSLLWSSGFHPRRLQAAIAHLKEPPGQWSVKGFEKWLSDGVDTMDMYLHPDTRVTNLDNALRKKLGEEKGVGHFLQVILTTCFGGLRNPAVYKEEALPTEIALAQHHGTLHLLPSRKDHKRLAAMVPNYMLPELIPHFPPTKAKTTLFLQSMKNLSLLLESPDQFLTQSGPGKFFEELVYHALVAMITSGKLGKEDMNTLFRRPPGNSTPLALEAPRDLSKLKTLTDIGSGSAKTNFPKGFLRTKKKREHLFDASKLVLLVHPEWLDEYNPRIDSVIRFVTTDPNCFVEFLVQKKEWFEDFSKSDGKEKSSSVVDEFRGSTMQQQRDRKKLEEYATRVTKKFQEHNKQIKFVHLLVTVNDVKESTWAKSKVPPPAKDSLLHEAHTSLERLSEFAPILKGSASLAAKLRRHSGFPLH